MARKRQRRTGQKCPCLPVGGSRIGVADALGYNRGHPVSPDKSFPMDTSKPQIPTTIREVPAERLDSWKEIAAYLKRDERTVRRWEKEGLPVHRRVHKKQASVYAYKAEIEAWWNKGRRRLEQSVAASPRKPRLWWVLAGLVTAGVAAFAVLGAGRVFERMRTAAAAPAIRSLVVLPLENLSGDPAQAYFADAVTDELTTELAQVPGLRVISRTSAMQYRAKRKGAPQIAGELHVDALVEGAVARSGNHVRITAQLIEAKNDRHLWARSFEGEVKDLVTLQDDAARKIAEQIRLHLPAREERQPVPARAIDPEAHDLYMHGIALRDNNDEISLDKSIDWFDRSLRKDPDYAPAHAGLAVAYTFQSFLGVLPSRETFPKAEEEARKAIALDPSLGEAHNALAWVAYVYKWDWPVAEKELRRALELNANDVNAHHYYSHYLFTMGRTAEALAEGEVAAGLDPLSQIQRNHLLWQYVEAREYDRAMEIGKKILDAGLTDTAQYVLIAGSYAGKGQFEQAVTLLQKAISLAPTRTESQAVLASVYARMGKVNEARKILRRLQGLPPTQFVSPLSIAEVYCALGDKGRALDWLEKAVEQHDASVSDLPSLPFLDPLRDDPRFQNLLRRVGLPARD